MRRTRAPSLGPTIVGVRIAVQFVSAFVAEHIAMTLFSSPCFILGESGTSQGILCLYQDQAQ
jgi:hypothetical protein